eukprot:5680682-Karenia_brevis.AAC.1
MLARFTAVKVTKVKGHAKESDVRTGTVKAEDKIGNDWADLLATAGADRQTVDKDALIRARRLRRLVLAVQNMM